MVRQCDVVVIFRDGVVGCDRAADEIGGLRRMAGVQCDEAEIMQTVGVTGVERDNAAILPFSFAQYASLMCLNRSGEEFRDGCLHRVGHSKFSPLVSGHGLSAIKELSVSCYPTG